LKHRKRRRKVYTKDGAQFYMKERGVNKCEVKSSNEKYGRKRNIEKKGKMVSNCDLPRIK